SGWLLTHFLERAGAAKRAKLRQRVVRHLTSTFASRYTHTIGLAEALSPAIMGAYERKATGQKYLIDPRRN
ncbi:MAG TPA: hypothetical protein VEX38_07240, partial [Fimbriimonadaceae bacterium]|nr:hypothetical protein [Fimbriimonadaceae bacterium]